MTTLTGAEPAARPADPETPRRPGRRWTRDSIETLALRVLRWVVIALLVLASVLPFYYMLMLSVRSIQDLLLDPGRIWVDPAKISLDAYRRVLRSVADGGQGFLTLIRNSLLVSVGTVIITLAASIPGAYAISRLAFRGRRQVSALFVGVYFFPSIIVAVPLFVLFARLGLRGSLFGLALVYVAHTIPVTIYMLRGYFDTIPVSLEEAALLDGCGRLGVIRRVSLPLAMPAVMATGLYVCMIAWNEFLFALLFLVQDRDRWTVSLGLAQLSGSIEVPTTVLMAGSVVLTIPIIALFFASERLLVEGLSAGAEKG
ncbi:carbohydrate ABC transporter membrane protein 2, CUT1 family [Micromonospora rhizosphaerae]|uniref:Carbohydrate ABC transporter membrane protein 2, CUT1 family n=1 Tax=Micromonospora rhizosphaerae TaxID=568872 RepID=A0A1C6T1N8_9ACTN|nr:carbohydrate ABC transporter permease [Micromonospora rhizosphaerae]SCL35678.1 carbohydrate ABC transporter membrane protein 2, CUT1 family [Micromonospora rhizosphaerae]